MATIKYKNGGTWTDIPVPLNAIETGGSLQTAVITRASEKQFDLSNYVTDGEQFYLVCTRKLTDGSSSYVKSVFTPDLTEIAQPAVTTTGTNSGITALIDTVSNRDTSMWQTGYTDAEATYANGILSIPTGAFGISAVLIYAG